MHDDNQILGGIKGHKIPIIENVKAKKKERMLEIRKQLMNNEKARANISALAESLAKDFNATTNMIVDIRAGAVLKDTLTGKSYAYEYFATPFDHDPRTAVIFEEAHMPLDEFPVDHIMILYDINANPSPRFIISSFDFCKYIAAKIWIVIDLNVSDEKDFINREVT